MAISCHCAFSGVPRRRERATAARFGMPRRIGIDDEDAVHAFVDVARQRQRMAVIEMAAERPGLELVDELAAGRDEPAPGTPSMRAAWKP